MARRSGAKTELNTSAMFDMGFQLLTFFILSFKPVPIEGQISLRLPPPQAVKTQTQTAPSSQSNEPADVVQGVDTIVISVFAQPNGSIAGIGVGEEGLPGPSALNVRLQTIFSDPAIPFEQVIVQVAPNLRYDELMRVIDVCTRQVLPDGKKLSKLSFASLGGE